MRLLKTFVFTVLPLSFALAVAAPRVAGFDQGQPPRARTTPGFDVSAMDRAANPCTDFYQFACGGWVARNPVPPDQARWGRFDELQERNEMTLRSILEKAAAPAARDANTQKIGDYYASCMDEAAIDAKGIDPLEAELDRIGALHDKSALPDELARLHSLGANALFTFGSEQDFKDATQVIAVADQGGLGLPDRDYYLKDDAKSVELRNQYLAHVRRMLALTGESEQQAAEDAQAVMDIETALAKGSLDRVQRREPANMYHKMTKGELASLSPALDWNRYLVDVQAPPIISLNVTVPDFFKAADELVKSVDLARWKSYLRWQLVHASAPILPKRFIDENFAFYGRTLTGTKELRPRWKRCVQYTDNDLGFALGKPFVEDTFGADGKARALKMVAALEKALEREIRDLRWMTTATKKQALVKLEAIANKIGYPDTWRDYGRLEIVRGDALGNSQRANAFEFCRQLDKIGKPVERGEWDMTPPTVDAYYNPLMNDINFPAGILQPPFFDRTMDDAVNFGAIGAVIGHELTHGFDDEGRQFDAKGNLRDWWTETDAEEFQKRAECLVDEYSRFTAVDDLHLNGHLTLGENTADNGGVRIALMALVETLGGKRPAPIDGFSAEQRLFLAWGQIWCQNRTDEVARMLAVTDPHSPGRYRVNGVVSNMPEFQKAFGCKVGSAMVNRHQCRVW
jgi:endothelin-converting enzyme/putative endopeptidase